VVLELVFAQPEASKTSAPKAVMEERMERFIIGKVRI
jgi:hypothetical protein